MSKTYIQLSFDFDFSEILEDLEFISGCPKNIKKMMPFLFESQAEDISFAEKRFENGKGYLFTNGTGTGKTFVGLGIAKRFYVQNKKDILIVVPTEKKCIDWKEEGEKFGLNVYKIQDTKDKGIDISVTTYANFYQNDTLLKRQFDLVIYDECHYLNQNEKGKETAYYEQHRKIVKTPSEVKANIRKWDIFYEKPNQYGYREFRKEFFEKKVSEIVEKTKVVFLSATPFAYHKSIRYADGCLFNIEETIEEPEYDRSYNAANGWEKFLVSILATE